MNGAARRGQARRKPSVNKRAQARVNKAAQARVNKAAQAAVNKRGQSAARKQAGARKGRRVNEAVSGRLNSYRTAIFFSDEACQPIRVMRVENVMRSCAGTSSL